MVVLDDLKNLVLYKKPFFLPIDENDKKHNSLIMLLTPNYQSSMAAMNAPYIINRRYFESYYLEKNVYRYIKQQDGVGESVLMDSHDPGEYVSISENNLSPVNDGYIFSKDNLYINFDKFKSGESNICFVTGLSGGGKSTLTQKIAKEQNAEWIELDIFEHCGGFEDENLKEAGQVFYDYLSAHKELWERLKKKQIGGKELQSEIAKFVDYCISWCKKHSDKKWVLEGVQVFSCSDPNKIKNYPIVFVRTSMLKSIIRRWKRNGDGKIDWKAELKNEPFKLLAWYIDNEKEFQKFQKAVLNEEEMKDTVDMTDDDNPDEEVVNESGKVDFNTVSIVLRDDNGSYLIGARKDGNGRAALAFPSKQIVSSIDETLAELMEEIGIAEYDSEFMYDFTYGDSTGKKFATDSLFRITNVDTSTVKNPNTTVYNGGFGFLSGRQIGKYANNGIILTKPLKRYVAQYGSTPGQGTVQDIVEKSNIVYHGYNVDVTTASKYVNHTTLKAMFKKCGVDYPESAINVIVSMREEDYCYIDEYNVTILSKGTFDRISMNKMDYKAYLNQVMAAFVYYTINPNVYKKIIRPLSRYRSGNIDKLIDKYKEDYPIEYIFKYIDNKYGAKEINRIVKHNDVAAIIAYASNTRAQYASFGRQVIDLMGVIDRADSNIFTFSHDIEPYNRAAHLEQNVESLDHIQEMANNNCMRLDNMLYFSEDSNASYDTILRNSLYQDRIRNSKQVLAVYKKVKEKLPFIRYTFSELSRYKNKNLCFDLSYYNESFFRNYAIDDGAAIKNLKVYKQLLRRLIGDSRFSSYTKKTIFIPVLDWRHNDSMRMWMYREDINPISIIYDMIKNDPNDLKDMFRNTELVFMGPNNYFKFNVDQLDFARGNVATGFITAIKRIVALGFTSVESDPEDEPTNSAKGIAMDLIDKVERSQNIEIKSVAPIMNDIDDNIKYTDDVTPEDRSNAVMQKVAKKDGEFDGEYKVKVDQGAENIKTFTKSGTKIKPADKITTQVVVDDPEKDTKPDKGKAVNTPDKDKQKENLVSMIAKASSNAATPDEAMDNLDDEFKELLEDIKRSEESAGSSNSQAGKVIEISEEFKNKEIAGKSVKDLLADNPNDAKLPTTKLPIASINDEWENMTFMNFDKTYDPDADIVKMLDNMKNWSHPIAVRDIDVRDNSTSEDYVNLWTIQCEDYKGTKWTLRVDVPKFINDKFLKLRGNEKNLMLQSTMMPIVKTDLDTCQIIGIGGYNKIFVRRYGSSVGKSMPGVNRLIKTLQRYDGKDLKVSTGDNRKVSNKYELPIDYIDLGAYYNTIETKNYLIQFNQDEMRKEYVVDDTRGLPIGIQKNIVVKEATNAIVQDNILYYGKEEAKNFGMVWRYILYLIMSDVDNPKDMVDVYNSIIATGKRYTYTRAKILNIQIPVVVVCAYVEGLTTTLKKAHINYTFKQKIDKSLKLDDRTDYIKFSDGYLVYDVTYSSTLLMNGLREVDTESYSLKDINSKVMYMDYLSELGGNLKADGLENSYDCMIDPITREILEIYKLPTDYVSVLLYANMLLADNKFVKHTDVSARRLRRKELIAGYFYKALSTSYQTYADMIRHSRKSVKMTMKQSAIIDMLLSKDPSATDLSTNNLINDVESANTVTSKGLVGMNNDRAYSLDKRGFDDTMLNILGMSTGFSGNVGINRQATIDCSIQGNRGFIVPSDTSNADGFGTAKTLTITEALTPFGSTHDDPFRTLMTYIQTSKHMVRTEYSDPQLVTNGADEAIAYLASDIFAFKAKKDGTVIELENGGNAPYMVIEYKDGTHEFIDLSEQIKKNSDGGYHVPLKLSTDLKVGARVKEGQIVAYDSVSLSNGIGESGNLAMNVGTLAKVAIINTDEGYEDSAACTAKFARMLGTDVVVAMPVTINKNSNVSLLKKIGDHVLEGDTILTHQSSYDDDAAISLLRNLQMDEDEISELGKNPIRSKHTGVIADIKVYRTVDMDELSPSLQKLVKDYETPIKHKRHIMEKYGVDTATLPPTKKVGNVGKTKNVYDAVLVEIYIKYTDEMAVGDKVVFYSANKGILKNIIPDGQEPYTNARPEEKIDAFVSISSLNGRMVTSTILFGSISKLMVELDRSCKDIAGIEYDHTRA